MTDDLKPPFRNPIPEYHGGHADSVMNKNSDPPLRTIPEMLPEMITADSQAQALNRIADALERMADVYLYVNDPEDGEDPSEGQSLSDVSDKRGMR